MHRLVGSWSLVLCAAVLATGQAIGQGKTAAQAPDFPPGAFSDGKDYHLGDMHGKVVVLFFYEAK